MGCNGATLNWSSRKLLTLFSQLVHFQPTTKSAAVRPGQFWEQSQDGHGQQHTHTTIIADNWEWSVYTREVGGSWGSSMECTQADKWDDMQTPGTDNHNHNLLVVRPHCTSAPLPFGPDNIQPSVLSIPVANGSFRGDLTSQKKILADVSLRLAEKTLYSSSKQNIHKWRIRGHSVCLLCIYFFSDFQVQYETISCSLWATEWQTRTETSGSFNICNTREHVWFRVGFLSHTINVDAH